MVVSGLSTERPRFNLTIDIPQEILSHDLQRAEVQNYGRTAYRTVQSYGPHQFVLVPPIHASANAILLHLPADIVTCQAPNNPDIMYRYPLVIDQ